jgi:S-adenosylmethionine synthetase
MYRTAEFVSPKHPDKLCDGISDKILDYCLALDPEARASIETMGGHGQLYINGEVTLHSPKKIPVAKLAREVLGEGQAMPSIFLNWAEQSPFISQGVDGGGAGDQGIMVGYACDENAEYVPEEYRLARSLCRFLYERFPYDGKTQVTMCGKGQLAIVASFQHARRLDLEAAVHEWVVREKYSLKLLHANPAGDWTQGGFDADAGLTGRKLVVDNYGPRVPVGGGAYSGKDPSKVDRSATYMARYIALQELRSKGLQACTTYLSYAIGIKEPLQATCIDHTGKRWYVGDSYPLFPNEIIKFLDLKRPVYYATSQWGAYGHGMPWDRV